MKKKKFIYKTPYGDTEVILQARKYSSNGSLAVEALCKEEFTDEYSPFAVLTVNLPDAPECESGAEDMAFLDTNNCPGVEEFFHENKLGKPTGIFRQSGFCVYPLYKIDTKKFDEPDTV